MEDRIPEKPVNIAFAFIVAVSAFMHLMFFSLVFFYFTNIRSSVYMLNASSETAEDETAGGDIVVNINQNDKKDYNEKTLLSDHDSEGTGKITDKKGKNWLNNSTEFLIKKLNSVFNEKTAEEISSTVREVQYRISFISDYITKSVDSGSVEGNSEWNKIPDVNDFKRENALYYSNRGYFSINTKKFRNFEYFNAMKNKIVSNWYPPILSNSVVPRAYNARGMGYTPGRTKFNLIPTQYVKLYFVLDRAGNVKSVVVFDSKGYKPLDDSCVESITKSRSFGPVPKDIPGDEIYIQFWFGYIVD